MKKFLSLVLALVMTMSLVTISAGAKDFTDKSSLSYKEAVDVVSTIGIVDGYTDGSFNPSATLTRGAAAKIICNLLLGPTTASALVADAAPYSDVPVSNVFSGYIAYCAQQGIISGYADGTFRPAGTLTSYAFMKMLLGALGYDASVEGFVGGNWSVQVAKTALGIGLDDGLKDDFNGIKPVTREEAALYAFNTLQANMVEYDAKTTIDVNGATVTVGGSKAKDVEYTNKTSDTKTIANDGVVQFAERYFSKLVLDGTQTDAFARPANKWTYKGDSIGTYAKKADVSYTKNTAMADIYDDAKLTSTSKTFDVYIDGIKANNFDATKANTVVIVDGDEDTKIGYGNGALVEVFKSEDTTKNGIITIINTYAGKVIAKEAATAKRDAYIEIGEADSSSVYGPYNGKMILGNNKFDTESFDVDDVVVFNYSLKTGLGEAKNVKAAEAVTGTVKSFTTTKKFSLDGTTYEYGAMSVNYYGSSDIGTESTIYMDANGYVLFTDEGKDNNKNYALVMNAGVKSQIAGDKYEAYLLYTDGTTAVVTTKDDETAKIGSWVTYKTNSKDEVILTIPAASKNHINDSVVGGVHAGMGKGASTTVINTVNGQTGVDLNGNGVYNEAADAKVNSGTIIIVKDAANKFKVYEGVKNIPTITGTDGINNGVDAYSAYGTGTFLKFLYVDVNGYATVDSGTAKTIFLVGDTTSKLVETDSDKYYVFDAVVDGKVVEDGVMLDVTDVPTATVANALADGTMKSYLLKTYAVDDGMYTVKSGDEFNGTKGDVLSVVNGDSGTKIEKVSGTCIDFGGAAFYTADNCVFYRVDKNGNLKTATISAVRTANVGTYYESIGYTLNNDAELTGVYWVEK